MRDRAPEFAVWMATAAALAFVAYLFFAAASAREHDERFTGGFEGNVLSESK